VREKREKAAQIRSTIAETEALLSAIEGARMQFSSAADQLHSISEETKRRLREITQELEDLRRQIVTSTQPGDLS
jgi:hypothetical protein